MKSLLLFLLSLSCLGAPPLATWTMINVNSNLIQGDAHLIEFPDGEKLLVDAGNNENALVEFLKRKKITQLTRVIVSHGHKDHYDGILPLLNAGIEIEGSVWMNFPQKAQCEREKPWGCDWENLVDLKEELKKREIPLRPYDSDRKAYQSKNAELSVLYAYEQGSNPVGDIDVNDTSGIMLLKVGQWRALFTGDLNRAIGKYLAEHGKNLNADILKVPHHGGDSVAPNEFLDRVGAEVALVPAPQWFWKDQRTQRIREYFEKEKIPTYVNGIHGNITVRFFEDRYEIKTDRGPGFVVFPKPAEPRRISAYTRPLSCG